MIDKELKGNSFGAKALVVLVTLNCMAFFRVMAHLDWIMRETFSEPVCGSSGS